MTFGEIIRKIGSALVMSGVFIMIGLVLLSIAGELIRINTPLTTAGALALAPIWFGSVLMWFASK
jgi:hypothetical protein